MKKTNEVMRVTGATRRQLQFYNNKGLLEASRTKDNHRVYSQESMEQLWEILIYKEAGFSLEEMKVMQKLSLAEKKEFLDRKRNDLYRQQKEVIGKAELIMDILSNGFPEKPTEDEIDSGITYIQKAENCLKKYVEKAGRKKR